MSDKIIDKLTEIQATCSQLEANQKNNYRAIQENSNILKSQAEILLRNTITVEHHEKRSTLLEDELRKTKVSFGVNLKEVRDELEPIKKHVEQFTGAGNLIRWVGYITGAGLGAYGLFTVIQKML